MGEKHIIPEPPSWLRPSFYILGEAPGAIASALWQYARHLRDWVAVGPPERDGLFHHRLALHVIDRLNAAMREAPDLAEALDRFGTFILSTHEVSARDAAAACVRVVQWAELWNFQRTAIEFAELAALLEPDSAQAANRAGRLNRNGADFARAEIWFERGIGLARRTNDHMEYTRGHIGCGILFQTLGKDRRARKYFQTAAIIARKDGRRWLAAEAQHDLMLMSAERGHFDEADAHATKALAWYPKHHKRFPFFVADLCFLLVCESHYSVAAELLAAFLTVIKTPAQQVLGMSLLVRALAGAGERVQFARTRARVLRLLGEFRDHEAAARIHLAEAERSAGLWHDAEVNARKALEIAVERRDAAPERIARALLIDIEQRVPPPTESGVHADPDWFATLIRSAATRLSVWAPTRRGRIPTVGRNEWAAA